jgi:FHS family L-fucose permease-like MFS transporter
VYFGIGYLCFSPVAAEILKRKGYKVTVLVGLAFYSTGAILFWPTAHFSSMANASASFGGFCACTAVIACGLSTLETAANSYAVVIGNPATASARLQFCQSFNGVASFIGPLIASKYFFSGSNSNNLTNVQFVYLAVSCAGMVVAVLFAVSRLPEVSEKAIEGMQGEDATAMRRFSTVAGERSIWKQYNMWFAFGAQVSVPSLPLSHLPVLTSHPVLLCGCPSHRGLLLPQLCDRKRPLHRRGSLQPAFVRPHRVHS